MRGIKKIGHVVRGGGRNKEINWRERGRREK